MLKQVFVKLITWMHIITRWFFFLINHKYVSRKIAATLISLMISSIAFSTTIREDWINCDVEHIIDHSW